MEHHAGHSLHDVKALALPGLSERATQTPHAEHFIYIIIYITIPRDVRRCFDFDNPFELARFLHRQSQSA